MPRPTNCRGISLVEILVVLTIIATLTTVTVPPLIRAQQTYGLLSAASQVRTELYRARILAITRNQDCRLRVTSSVTHLVECQTPEWIPVVFHQVTSGFTITANNRPEFHPLGNVAPMATISIWNTQGGSRQIIISRGGRIRTE